MIEVRAISVCQPGLFGGRHWRRYAEGSRPRVPNRGAAGRAVPRLSATLSDALSDGL